MCLAGVVRERVGDILVQGETGAQILVHPELVEHFETSLTQVCDTHMMACRASEHVAGYMQLATTAYALHRLTAQQSSLSQGQEAP